jgi:hypothetical protein
VIRCFCLKAGARFECTKTKTIFLSWHIFLPPI